MFAPCGQGVGARLCLEGVEVLAAAHGERHEVGRVVRRVEPQEPLPHVHAAGLRAVAERLEVSGAELGEGVPRVSALLEDLRPLPRSSQRASRVSPWDQQQPGRAVNCLPGCSWSARSQSR